MLPIPAALGPDLGSSSGSRPAWRATAIRQARAAPCGAGTEGLPETG
jgi:hypothetical protein